MSKIAIRLLALAAYATAPVVVPMVTPAKAATINSKNCARSGCGAAVSCYESGLGNPEIAEFPVRFPVSREFAWRRVRSALRRQRGSLVRTAIFPIYNR